MFQPAQSNNVCRTATPAATGVRRNLSRGFTLIELLLVVALLMAMMGAVVFNFSSLLKSNQLEEGTTRLETLMRFARAQAANSGRKVQLVFGSESTNAPSASTGEVHATWEADPLKQPGCFSDLLAAQWHVQELNDIVHVESVKVTECTSGSTPTEPCDDDFEDEFSDAAPAKPMPPITFYPDGSSDSAEIIVAVRSAEDDQRMSVRLVGLTGSISHQLLSSEVEDIASDATSMDRFGPIRRDSVWREPAAEPDSMSRGMSSHAASSSSRTTPTVPRATVGETNSLDRGE